MQTQRKTHTVLFEGPFEDSNFENELCYWTVSFLSGPDDDENGITKFESYNDAAAYAFDQASMLQCTLLTEAMER